MENKFMNNLYPENRTMPANILFEKWADIGFEWQGSLSVNELARLAEQTIDDSTLQATCTLSQDDGILWLQYTVAGQIKIACQRCLEPLQCDIDDEYRLAVLTDESQLGKIADAEYVLLDEVLTGDGRRMLPIKDLLEDELILSLPLSPRHDDCELYVDSAGDEIIDEQESDNPFAALAALKGRLS